MWQLHETLANLQTEQLIGTIDLRQPQLGLHALRMTAADQPVGLAAASLLRLSLPSGSPVEEIRECWVRGSDLVAVYAPTSSRASQPEIYWRCLSSPHAIGLELIVSIHTGLLDDNPATSIVSELPASETWWLPSTEQPESARRFISKDGAHTLRGSEGRGSCIVRMSSQVSYIEMAHPSDFCSTELTWRDGRVTLHTPLFPDRLEKGVIRRGRLRGWFVASAGDLAAAGRLYQEFAESEPPLTT